MCLDVASLWAVWRRRRAVARGQGCRGGPFQCPTLGAGTAGQIAFPPILPDCLRCAQGSPPIFDSRCLPGRRSRLSQVCDTQSPCSSASLEVRSHVLGLLRRKGWRLRLSRVASSHRCDFPSRSVICTCVYTNSSLLHNSPWFAYFVPRGVYRGMSDLASPPRPRPNLLATDPQFQC